MLDDSGLRMMELAGKGYCCSQIVVLLALDELGRDNPDLVRAASGLCMGMGGCSGPCGVHTGAALVLGLHAGKGTDMETQDDKLPLMLEELRDWFAEATAPYGGMSCGDILDGECGQPHQSRCGGLLSAVSAQVRRILAEHGLDPAEGREQE
ncbi:DVU_1555 family C-GCAxxG-C-C protein [Salidesulfovibrio onnuriiensis]|uniref:DVU_1555 family C-GCAxxG-C-C protein n=1 Tax=Salidesulfovibrio onnuriiensis TaxID=2583823 RepID=UPI0011C7CCE5|nr:DV_1555 family C-GCAxxG-C-C protein [Salidesulfovibrio onnuriiensis]